jgi:acetyl esterase/lipase
MKRLAFAAIAAATVAAIISATGLNGPAGAVADSPHKDASTKIAGGLRQMTNIEYSKAGADQLLLDIYAPQSPQGKLPLVVWIHGGGWISGSRASCPKFLAQRGYVVATIDYRLAPGALWPAQIEDCKAAVRFLRANADKYGIDADRVGVWGASAGGQLAAMMGATGDVKALEGKGGNEGVSSGVQAVCDFAGPTDLEALLKDKAHAQAASLAQKLLGPALDETAKSASPINYVNKDNPPFLIMHGQNDKLVPVSQPQLLADALKKAGVDVTFKIVPGAAHDFGGQATDAAVAAFFDAHLKRPAKNAASQASTSRSASQP